MMNFGNGSKEFMVIGITGPAASGKGTFRDLLLKYLGHQKINTYFFSMSDEVRREAAKENSKYTREDLSRISMNLKKQFGPSVLAYRALDNIERTFAEGASPRIVVTEAIRNIREVEEFRNRLGGQFILIAIVASMEILVDRVMLRQRYDENTSVLTDRLKVTEMIEAEVDEDTEYGHQIQKCIDSADVVIRNDGSIESLKIKIEELVKTRIASQMK